MTPSNQIPAVCNYGTSAVYSDYPSPEQMRAGVVPLDSLPAAWWNKMWCASNCAINEARDMVGQIITEVNNVLCQAGINPQAACTDQLYQSINKIRQTLATASVPGAVVSSSVASEVAVDPTTGRMTVNCLGNAASLSTSASTVVGAINELKSTYDCCISDTATALNGKAPTSHASSATTYGVGSADNYGHLKISDTYTSVLAACSGVAASQKALACVYAVACAAAAGNVSLGNTAGCALGTAAAGTAITAARSDHVHPKQTCVACAGAGPSGTAFGSAAYCAATAFRASTWTPSLVNCSCYNYIDAYTASADRGVVLTCAVTAAGQYQTLGPSTNCKFTFNPATGEVKAKTFTGALAGCACCAGRDGSGCAFGTAARYACGCFRASTWTPSCVSCAGWAGCSGCSCKMYDATANGCACINGKVNCCCSANAAHCYLYSCSGLSIRPTISGITCIEGTTRISTYVFDGSKTTVCALRQKLHDMFSLASNTCYCYPSQYACTVGEPVAGYAFIDGKRQPISGIKFADSYNGTIYIMSCPGTVGIGGLYVSCGACLICNYPGITCLAITTLFYPSW